MEVEAVLADGPFSGDRAFIDQPEAEHIRVFWCRRCGDAHWCDELDDYWPMNAARYALATASDGEEAAVYVHDGLSPDRPEVEEHEYAPEPVTA